MSTDYNTPPGRIVWGHPLEGRKRTDDKGTPLRDDEGNIKYEWSFGLAIPKDQCAEIFAIMTAEAETIFPNGTPGDFAWKFKDGDTGR